MTTIESSNVPLDHSAEEAFAFLSNLNNHRHLMPSQVSEWSGDREAAKFRIQGLGALHLKISEVRDNSYIKIIPVEKAPVDLYLEWFIESEGVVSKAKVVIHADLNFMMKMVAVKPLQNLADAMAEGVNAAIKKAV